MFWTKSPKLTARSVMEDLFSSCLDAMPQPYFINCVLPGEEGIVFVNKAFAEGLGVPANELIGRHVATLLAPIQPFDRPVADHVKLVEENIHATGRWSGPAYFVCSSGRRLEVQFDVGVTMCNGKPYAFAIMEEINAAEQKASRKIEMQKVADEFQETIGNMVSQIANAAALMQSASHRLTLTAHDTSQQSQAVAAAAAEAETNVTSVAGATEELGSAISEITRQVKTSSEVALGGMEEAQVAAQVVRELNTVADSIGSVVDMIAGLASQTNLLALNATIEAARAGDSGRGFAVVASEVKTLASQTARATTEISEKIGLIQTTTARAVDAIEAVTNTIRELNKNSNAIAMTISQQNEATHEIAGAVGRAASGTSAVSVNIAQVARSAVDTGAAAGEVLGASSELSESASRVQAEMVKFLSKVRAA